MTRLRSHRVGKAESLFVANLKPFFDNIGQQPTLAVNGKVRTILNCSLNQSILSRYLSTMEGEQLVIVNSLRPQACGN